MNKTDLAVDVFNSLAKEYQDKFMDLSLYHATFDVFCEGILTDQAEILELTCGPGNITKYLLDKRPDFRILATDLAPNMLELARINNPTAEFQLLNCKDLGSLEKSCDGIICGFGLPYLSKDEALQLIADASEKLNPGGILYLSTMEDDYEKSTFKTSSSGFVIFMHYHRADYLTAALEENGFEIIQVTRQDFPEKDGTITTDLIIIARRNAAKTKAALKVVL